MTDTLELAWSTYAELFDEVAYSVGSLLSVAAANKVTRYTMARVFQLACTGWESEFGPYAEALDIARPMVGLEASRQDVTNRGMPYRKMSDLSESFFIRVASLYATIYEMQYLGEWSLQDREIISLHIRVTTPESNGSYTIAMPDKAGEPHLAPLRRAVKAYQAHPHAEHLICAVASQVAVDETSRGLRWYEGITAADTER